MSDVVVSFIRTYVPVLVGAVLTWLGSVLDIVVPEDGSTSLIAGITAVVIAAYYAVIRLLERKWPWFGILLGKSVTPTYTQ